MRIWLGLMALAVLLTASVPIPRCVSVDPETGKRGDVITAKGENLNKAIVAEVFLTDGQKDTAATIVEQVESEIKFQVPDVVPGRYHVLFLSSDRSAIVEQPVIFTVR